MSHVDFTVPPAIGTELVLDRQRYQLEATRPHVRRDGVATTILIWRSECPKCGGPFTVTSGLVSKALNRRCDGCKRAGAPVSRKRGKAAAVTVFTHP